MRTIMLFILMLATGLVHAEKHIVISAPILGAADKDGKRAPLGVTFNPSRRAAATAVLRSNAIMSGMKIDEANVLRAPKEQIEATPKPATEYHLIVPDSFDHVKAGATYAATWDGRAPYITVLVGNHNAITHAFAGWPMLTKAELPKVETTP